jgi:hypothetical protein
MRGKLIERVLRRVAIGAVCVVAGGGLCWGLHFGYRYLRVEWAIGRLEAGPSQARADVLVGLLEDNIPTVKQGERMLELLLTPQVTTRASYPLGRCPMIALGPPFALRFQNAGLGGSEELLCNGTTVRHSRRRGGKSEEGLLLIGPSPAPEAAGTYRLEVRQERLLYQYGLPPTWVWRPWGGPFPRCLLPYRRKAVRSGFSPIRCDYACSVAVAAEIVMVEESEAETVGLVSNPRLDEAMRAALVCGMSSSTGNARSEAAGTRGNAGWVRITYQDLPAAVGFKSVLILSDGREIRGRKWFYARAGSAGQFTVSPADFVMAEAGSYTGSLALRADPEVAYEDAAIKTIWDGTLEFPVSFEFSPGLSEP